MKRNSLILGHFGRTLNPISAMKKRSKKITLVDEDKIMNKDKNVAEIMNNYFLNKTKTLKVIKEF